MWYLKWYTVCIRIRLGIYGQIYPFTFRSSHGLCPREGKGVYLTVYPLSCFNTETVCCSTAICSKECSKAQYSTVDFSAALRPHEVGAKTVGGQKYVKQKSSAYRRPFNLFKVYIWPMEDNLWIMHATAHVTHRKQRD